MSENSNSDGDEPARRKICPFDMALPLARTAIDMAPDQPYGYVALSLTSKDFRERTGATIKAVEMSREKDPADVVGRAGLMARLLLEPRRWCEEDLWRVWGAHGVLRGSEKAKKEAQWRYEEEEVYERVREALKDAWKEFDEEDYDDDTTTTSCTSLTNSSDDGELDGKDEADSEKDICSEEKSGDDGNRNNEDDENDVGSDKNDTNAEKNLDESCEDAVDKKNEDDVVASDQSETKQKKNGNTDETVEVDDALLYLARVEYRLGMLFRTIQPSKVHRPRSRKHFMRALKHLPATHPLHETITFWLASLRRKELMESASAQKTEPAVAAMVNFERGLEKCADGSCSSFSERYDEMMEDSKEEVPIAKTFFGECITTSTRPRWHVDLVEEANPTGFWGKAFGMYYL